MWGTRGTETSKYPEEEKENLSISKVAASEMEGAQTVVRASRGSDCDMRDVRWENGLGSPAGESESLVSEIPSHLAGSRVGRDTRNLV